MVIDTIFKLITDSLLNCTDHADASNIHEVPSAYVYLSSKFILFKVNEPSNFQLFYLSLLPLLP